MGVNNDRREVFGLEIGASEAETFWTEFLRTYLRVARLASEGDGPRLTWRRSVHPVLIWPCNRNGETAL